LEILGAKAYPIYIVRQLIINKDGKEALKFRPYHHLCFSPQGIENLSVNKSYSN